MRKSLERHPLAVLRKIIGLSQEAFSKEMGLSLSTVSKIESLRLPLSVENALLISSETGCSSAWLIAGDPKAPPLAGIPDPSKLTDDSLPGNFESPPYSPKFYQYVQARKKAGQPVIPNEEPDFYVISYPLRQIIRALHHASKNSRSEYALTKLYNLTQEFTNTVGITDPMTKSFVSYQDNVISSIGELTELDLKPY